MGGKLLLRNDGDFRLRKFRSAGKAALGDEHSSRRNLSVKRERGVNIVVYKVGCERVGGALRSAKHYDGVFARHVVAKVIEQAFKLAAPRRKGQRAEIRHGTDRNFAHRAHEGIHEHGARSAEHGVQIRCVGAEFVAAGEQNSLLEKYGNVLVLLRGDAFEHALEGYVLRNADDCLRHIVEKGCGEFIDERDVSVRRGKPESGVKPLQILLNMRLGCNALLSAELCVGFLQRRDELFGGIRQNLARGGNGDAVRLCGAALCFEVKERDGVDFVAPELDSGGVLLLRGVKIQYAAANGELAGAVDLRTAFVSGAGKARGKVADVGAVAPAQCEGVILVRSGGQGELQRRLRRGNDNVAFAYQNAPEHRKAALLIVV